MDVLLFRDGNLTQVEEQLYVLEQEDGFGAAMAVLYLLVCAAGLAGNALVVAAVLKLDGLSSPTTVYIFNLALADGLFMAGLPFVASQSFQNRWVFGDAACRAVVVLDGINQFTSAFCLTAMSLDRCAALARPLTRWRTPRCAKAVSALLWLCSLLTVLPLALHFSAHSGLCVPDFASDDWWLAVLTYTFVLGFALPYLLMLGSYAALTVALRRRRAPEALLRGRRERQLSRMVLAVVLLFGACWLPFYGLNFCSLHGGGLAPGAARAFQLSVLLSYAWSCANPVLYALLSDSFRGHFRALLCPATKAAHTPSMQCDTEGCDLSESESQSESETETSVRDQAQLD